VLQSLGKPAPAPRALPGPPRKAPSVPPPPRASQRVPSVPGVPAVPPPPGAPVTVPAPGVPVAPASSTMTAPVSAVIRPPAPPSRGPVRRPTSDPPPKSPAPPAERPARPPHSATTQLTPVLPDPAELTALEDLLDHGRLDEALAGYRLMTKRHASDRNVRAGIELCEGLLALGARDRLEAAQRFETALEIDPSNERAARELAEMRRLATNERKGLLSRLMGKKEP
jgi:hypothetical protein